MNFLLLLLYALTMGVAGGSGFGDISGITLWAGTLQWLVYDIVVNLRFGKEWYYVGDTAKSDRILKDGYKLHLPHWLAERLGTPTVKLPGLGENAGIYKAVICFLIVAACNVLHFT